MFSLTETGLIYIFQGVVEITYLQATNCHEKSKKAGVL